MGVLEYIGIGKQASFWDKLVNAWKIFKTSIAFIGRDKSLLAVPILLILSTIGFFALFLISFLTGSSGSLAIFANIIIFMFIIYFWSTFLGAAQAWMVYEVAQGKDATLFSGIGRALKNILDILACLFVLLLIKIVVGSLRGKG